MSDNPPVEKTPEPKETAEPTPGQPAPKQTDEKAPAQAQSSSSKQDGDRTITHVTNDKPITDKLAAVFAQREEEKKAASAPAAPAPAPAEPARPVTPKTDTLPRKPAGLGEPPAPTPAAPAPTAEKPAAKAASAAATPAPAAPTMPATPATPSAAPVPSAPAASVEVPGAPPAISALPDIENPYLLSGEVDRARLVAQSRMFRTFIENNAKRIAGENVKRILDIGCGEGQLTQVFAKLYPDAHVIGFDKDEKAIETAQRRSEERRVGKEC